MNDLSDRDYFYLVAIGSAGGLLAVTSNDVLCRVLFALSGSVACGFVYFYRRYW